MKNQYGRVTLREIWNVSRSEVLQLLDMFKTLPNTKASRRMRIPYVISNILY
jgi:hypothetical protein